ncbi:hypothetical protein FA13DRAFT_1727664 [Coprinellus micaceus]|uniref:VWFA domain-containing protein n=1 Tax=Coprinellus micaceus TaxID=71717 RepID=A0A4Y7TPK0_COPMI|nr:hypothetical protein FA13DRAFT_1727664 [Coprinellus micaceus]
MKHTSLRTEAEISFLFQHVRPKGPTHIGSRLKEISADYLAELVHCRQSRVAFPKPRNYIVITDGAPTAPDDVTNFLKTTARLLKKLDCDPTQLGFQFVQIGEDKEATDFLTYLDNNKNFERDIVDTVKNKGTQTMKSILRGLLGMDDSAVLCRKLLLGGISRFHDRKGDVPTKRR